MTANLLDTQALTSLTRDGRILFATRFVRLFAYGALSVVLLLYLTQLGFSEAKSGLLMTLTLLGDTAISLWITTAADRIGRKLMLVTGAVLIVLAGGVFVLTHDYLLLIIAATIGVISPSGNEVGPFLAIEQAVLSQLADGAKRKGAFAWYNLTGSIATRLGCLAAGVAVNGLQSRGVPILDSYKAIVIGYAVIGALLAVIFLALSTSIEVLSTPPASLPPNIFLPRQYPGGYLGAHRLAARGSLRSDQHDGLHPHTVEHLLDPGSADAESAVGHHASAPALQYLADGCSNATSLHDGSRRSERALRRCRRHRSRADDGRGIGPRGSRRD